MGAPVRRGVRLLLFGTCAWLAVTCSSGISPPRPSTVATCGPYPDQTTSPYVLPYPVGDTHVVFQGNCDNISHLADTQYKYAYDFRMTVGEPVVAVAAGRVVKVLVGMSRVDDARLQTTEFVEGAVGVAEVERKALAFDERPAAPPRTARPTRTATKGSRPSRLIGWATRARTSELKVLPRFA